MTANTYIRNRRLSLAGQEIVGTDIMITELTFKYGYEIPDFWAECNANSLLGPIWMLSPELM